MKYALAVLLLASGAAHAAGTLQINPGDTCAINCVDGAVPPIIPPVVPPVIPPVIPPIVGGPIKCDGFANTIVLNIDWALPQRVYTSSVGNFGPRDAVVVVFTSGSLSTPNNNLARIAAAEYQSAPSTRVAVLSPKACDWGPQPMQGATVSGTSVTVPFAVGTGSNFGFYPTVPLNTTYYYNIKNVANPSCANPADPSFGNCNIAIDLAHPGVSAVANALVAPANAATAKSAIAKKSAVAAKPNAVVKKPTP